MKKPKFISLAGALLAIGVLIWLLLPHEPVYHGKTLSTWLKEQHDNAAKYDGAGIQSGIQALDAVQHIGSNAVPVLLRLARTKDSALRSRIRWLESKLKIPVHWSEANDRHEMAIFGFRALGPAGASAVPQLISMLSDKDARVRVTAATCLYLIGPDARAAVPVLLNALNDRNLLVRHAAILALGNIHAQPELVVPALDNQLTVTRNTTDDLELALMALGRFGPEAHSAVSNILLLTDDSNTALRETAVSTLRIIDPEAAAKIKPRTEIQPVPEDEPVSP